MEKSFKCRLPIYESNPIGLGCWALGGRNWGGQSEKAAFEVMETALESGIRHFDTARVYGVSEKLVGSFLKESRSEVFLASKVYPTGSKAQVKESLQRSLDALQTDYIDLFYLHWPVRDGDNVESMEALMEARQAGLIGAIGVSNYSLPDLEMIVQTGPVDFLQAGYHLLWRSIEEGILPFCRKNGIRVVAYSSLGQGILTGKFPRNPEFPKGDHRANHVLHFRKDVWPDVYETVEELKGVAASAGRQLAHLALQWVAAREGITSLLVGARKAGQVVENAGALKDPVDSAILDALTRISDALDARLPSAQTIFGK
ncbi:MAG: aldo/keto reductase [Puniceicoccaceae bacterium]